MTQASASPDIVLDEHTASFFGEQWHAKPIEARFRLDGKGLENRVFVGRLVPLHEDWCLLFQEEVVSGGSDETGPSFVVWTPFPRFTETLSPEQIHHYWEEQLEGENAPIKPERDELMRTLEVTSLSRCHFDQESGLGCEIEFSWQESTRHSPCCLNGSGYLSDLQTGPRRPLNLPEMSTGMAWIQATSANDWLRAVVDAKAVFHNRMNEILRDPTERLCQAFRFFSQDDEARLCAALPYDKAKRERARQLLLSALQVEMGKNPLLQNAQKVTWCLWAYGPLSVGDSLLVVPPELEEMRKNIYAKLDLEPDHFGYDWRPASNMEEFLQEIASDWVRQLGYPVDEPSSHELSFAIAELEKFFDSNA